MKNSIVFTIVDIGDNKVILAGGDLPEERSIEVLKETEVYRLSKLNQEEFFFELKDSSQNALEFLEQNKSLINSL